MAARNVVDFLNSVDLFQALSEPEVEQVADLLHERSLQADEVVCRAGERADALFIVLSGRVRWRSTEQGAPHGEHSRGEVFGETAVLSHEPWPATAYAATDTRVLVLAAADLERLFDRHPRMMRSMLALASRRAVSTNRQLLADEPERDTAAARGQVVAVFSPRGGAGKTTLAVALAVRAATAHARRVALFDVDVLFDDVGLMLGVDGHTALARLEVPASDRFDRPTLNECLARTPHGPSVLVGSDRPEDGERLTAGHVRAALAALKQQFEVTIVDYGTGFGEPALAALEHADRVVMVCTPEMSTLRDARECQRILSQALHVGRERLYYVLNHPRPVRGLTRLQFETALEQEMAIEVPFSEPLGAAMDPERMVTLVRGRDAFGQALERQVRDLVGDAPERSSAQAAQAGGGGRLFGFLHGRR